MLDLRFVRENLAEVERMLQRRRGDPAVLADFGALDAKRRQAIKELEDLKARRNSNSERVAELRRSGGDTAPLVEEGRRLGQAIKELEPETTRLETDQRSLLASIPNMPDPSVPEGDETANLEVRRVLEPRAFDFVPKNHWELGEDLGLMDFGRASKISGSRFVVLAGALARLNRALISLMLDLHVLERGYREIWPPALVNSQSMFGTGQLPKFGEDGFKIEGADLWLVPTAEVPLTNLWRDEIIAVESLPVAVTAYTPCFRAEAGAAGRDTRGMIRMHQFDKVELVKITRPEDSAAELERLTSDAEEVLKRLELPYRVMLLSTGDMGFASAKTYDLEVWLPGPGVYREISSCSCFTDFQARRANIKFRRAKGAKPELAHTLNGSGLAVGRTLVAILENHQRADGSITVPGALRPYMGGLEVIERHG
jgi:seryl-tRNA synthetase